MEKSLVIFYSKHGYTKNVANKITKVLNGDLLDLSKKKDIDLELYDKIIIGSSIYAGSINKKVKQFINNNLEELLDKKIGLFICCADEKKAQEQFKNNFPQELIDKAFVKGLLGGEILLEKLNFFEKKILQIVTKQKKDLLNRKEEVIDKFLIAVQK